MRRPLLQPRDHFLMVALLGLSLWPTAQGAELFRPGQWMEHEVSLPRPGYYDLNLRVASAAAGASLRLDIDGTTKEAALTVPNTGGWQNWSTVTVQGLYLAAGKHTLRATFSGTAADGYSAGLEWMRLTVAQGAIAGPVLTPGSGWTGPTPQPPAVGDPCSPYYDCNAIAQWDVVPYQTFTQDFAVGVPAFHIAGISRVEFSVDNGPSTIVTTMTLNPQTNVVEYWAYLRASLFNTDRKVEVRAVAYPTIGIPRVLGGLVLYANKGGTLPHYTAYVDPNGSDTTGDGSSGNPYKTIARAGDAIYAAHGSCEGASIYCKKGAYSPPSSSNNWANNRWCTIEPAPGVNRADVILTRNTYTYGPAHLLKLYNVTLIPPAGNYVWMGTSPPLKTFWYDHALVTAVDRYTNNGELYHYQTTNYFTDVTWTQMYQGPYCGSALIRNCAFSHLCGDLFNGARMAINCTVDDVNRVVPGVPCGNLIHGDLYQLQVGDSGGTDNAPILYGITMTNYHNAGTIFSGQSNPSNKIQNAAFVNISCSYSPDSCGSLNWYWDCSAHHVLFTHLTSNQTFLWRGASGVTLLWDDFKWKDCVMDSMVQYLVDGGEDYIKAHVTFENCTGTFRN